jgi:threonine 3-dehydrogenase
MPHHGPREVLIRIRYTGICGTDLHIFEWDAWAAGVVRAPMVIGHEFVGEVAAVGADVSEVEVGDLVSGEGHLVCGRCRNCLAGRRHLCARVRGLGVNVPGAFAQYLVLPETNVWRLEPEVDQEVAAVFDPLGNAVHAALSFPLAGEDLLITGAGPIGLMSVAVARHAGARHVVSTDPNPVRRELALKMGATLAIDPNETTLEQVRAQLGLAEGFDVGLEMSGSGPALRGLLSNMRNGGQVALLGIPAAEQLVDWNVVIFRMLTLKGVYGREMFETWHKMSVLVGAGLDVRPVITHRLPAQDYDAAFAAVRGGAAGKVILDWTRLD